MHLRDSIIFSASLACCQMCLTCSMYTMFVESYTRSSYCLNCSPEAHGLQGLARQAESDDPCTETGPSPSLISSVKLPAADHPHCQVERDKLGLHWLPSSAGMLARLTSIVEAGSASIDWRGLSLQLTAHGLPSQIEVGGDGDSTGPAKDWLQALQRGCIAQQVIKSAIYIAAFGNNLASTDVLVTVS